MFTLSFAASFGALLQAPQIVPGLPETRAAVAEAQAKLLSAEDQAALRAQWTAEGRSRDEIERRLIAEKRRITGPVEQGIAARVTTFQEMGGLAGRCALVLLAIWIVSRRRLLRLFLIPATVVLPVTFAWAGATSLPAFERGLFLAGFLLIGQFSFWGNYLPRVYPLHLRGTGESFAANVGGRMDNRGMGYTTDNDQQFNYRLFAQDVIGLLDSLGVKQTNVLGYSQNWGNPTTGNAPGF